MVAIFTGLGLGLERGSGFVLGSRGMVGNATLGRANDNVFVNAATGNLVINNRDELLIGQGPDSVFNRTYNSLGLMDDENSDNWATFGSAILAHVGTYNVNGAYVDRRNWDGDVVRFYYDSTYINPDTTTGAYVSKEGAGAYDTLIYSGSQWAWIDGDTGLKESYNSAFNNRVVAKTDRDGNAITYTYLSATGNLSRVTTQDGNFTDLVWDTTAGKTNNLLMLTTSFTDTQTSTTKYLTRTRYSYDSSNRLETVTVDLSPEHANGAAGTAIADSRTYVTSYTYHGSTTRIATISQTDGSLLSFTYDGSGRILTFVETVDGSTTRTTSFTYNTGSTAVTDPQGNVTTFQYNSAGQLRKLFEPDPITGNTISTVFTYDTDGNVILARKLDGNNIVISEEAFAYDRGNLTEHIDATGRTTRWVYDAKNLLQTRTVYTGLEPDGLLNAAPSGAMTTHYVYDVEGHLACLVTAEGRVTRYKYEDFGGRRLEYAYINHVYTGSGFAEADLLAWHTGLGDQTNIAQRRDTTYDFRGNISSVTTYATTNSAGGAVLTDYTRVTYVYDQYGNLLSRISNESGAVAETYAYDGMGRTIRFTDAKGVGTWTSYIDNKNRTVTTLASGLTTTSVYNRAGELISTSESRNAVSAAPLLTDISQWTTNVSTFSSADPLDGATARQVTIQTGAEVIQSPQFSPVAGRAYTFTISLQATGLTPPALSSVSLGLFSSTDTAGVDGFSSARIITGPGTLSQNQGSFFGIMGLSGTEVTRVEITRYFDHTPAYGQVMIYPDHLHGSRVGKGLIVSAPSLVQSAYQGNFDAAASNLSNWIAGNLLVTDPGLTIDGGAARQYTVGSGGSFAAVYASPPANAGDSFTYTASFRAVSGSLTQQDVGIWADGSYGGVDNSVARIISGPGTITQLSNGSWRITGLSTTEATRFEITRVLRQDGAVTIYNFIDINNWSVGQSLIVAAPTVVRTPGNITSNKYDSLGRLRIKQDPVGTRTFYYYDKLGRKIGEVDGEGSVTEYKYDASDNLVATVRYATALTSTQIASLFDSYYGTPTSVTFADIRPTSNNADRWSWMTYDKQGRVVATVDAAGQVTTFTYDGTGQLVYSYQYATLLSTTTVNGYKTTLPATIGLPAVDLVNDRNQRNLYDKDGLLVGQLDARGYLTEFLYDKAGRKIESISWATQIGTGYSGAAQIAFWQTETLANLKATISAVPLSDIHNYWIYDGRGLVIATINGEGYVTRYHYNARGDLDQEVRGQQVPASTSYTMATLPAASGTLEVTDYTRDTRGQIISRVRSLSNSKTETTLYTYDRMGNLLSETVSDTVIVPVSTESRTSTFRYDAKGQLVGSLGGNGSAALAALGSNPTQAQIDTIYATYGTRFVYDPKGKMIAKITPDGTGATGLKTLYYYDKAGRLRFEINAAGEVVESRYNVLGDQHETIVYGTRIDSTPLAGLKGGLIDAALTTAITNITNALLDSKTSRQFDGRGLATELKDALNYSTALTYTSFGQLYTQQLVVGGDAGTQSVTYGYTRTGQRGTEYRPSIFGQSGGALSLTTAYDFFGRAASYVNNSDGRTTTIGYDRASQMVKRTDALNNFSEATFDARSNQITAKDRNGNVTTFEYDLFNRNITTVTPEGISSTVTKNAFGQTIFIKDGANRTVEYQYDKNGNLKKIITAGGTADEIIVENFYDNADRLIRTIDPRYPVSRPTTTPSSETTFTYDAVGRVLTRVQDAGSGKLNLTTTYVYDAKGQQVTVTEGAGSAAATVTKFEYDLNGQQLKVIRDFGSGKLNIATKFEYRADGKVTKMIEAYESSVERVTTYVYDAMGQLLETHVDPTGLNVTTKYSYDANGNAIAFTDERNNVTRFVFDKENRQIFSINAEGEVVETGYDKEGRVAWTRAYTNRALTLNSDLAQSETAVRTALGTPSTDDRIVRTLYDKDGRKAWIVDGEGYATRFIYDGGRYDSVIVAGNDNLKKTIHYVNAVATTDSTTKADLDSYYGSVASPPSTAAVTLFGYDNANRLISTTDALGYTESYTLDPNGNREKITNKKGGITEYFYDGLGRVIEEKETAILSTDTTAGTSATSYSKNKYEYDALGRVTHQIQAYGRAEQRDIWFTYDALGRRTATTGEDVSVYNIANDTSQTVKPKETFKYDARGNVIESAVEAWNGTTLVYSARSFFYYDKADRKTAEIDAAGTYRTYTPDAHGNVTIARVYDTLVTPPTAPAVTAPSAPGGTYRETTFGYDKVNRLTGTQVASVFTGSFSGGSYTTATATVSTVIEYNAFGNAMREQDGNGNSVFHYFDHNGRETAKVDQEKYLTTWTRDTDGNVLSETRYATQLTMSVSTTSSIASLVGNAGTSSDNRTTNFTYDKNGRRLTETRTGLTISSVSSTGSLTTTTNQSATITYEYNALGQVTLKKQATYDLAGGYLDNEEYQYDNYGRLEKTLGATITDHSGATTRLKTNYYYDALGNLVNQRAANNVTDGDAHVTRYHYDGAGRLAWSEDAAGTRTTMEYGANGQMVESRITRYRSDGTTAVTQKQRMVHDILGRVIEQYVTSVEGGVTTHSPVSMSVYNAHGEVTATKMRNYADSPSAAVTLETYEYDNAGRMIRSNSGDGVYKLFVYDKNGNATLTLVSAGSTDLSSANYASTVSGAIGNGTLAGFVQTSVIATIGEYDKRGMQTATIEPGRTIAATDVTTTTTAHLRTSRSYNGFGEVASETSARGNLDGTPANWTSYYTYNTMGRLIQKASPIVGITSESGVTTTARTNEYYYYDKAGRLVASTDANGYVTSRLLRAGTGHTGGGEALVLKEFRPDASVWETRYDVHGQARKSYDGLLQLTEQSYDALGRVTQVIRPSGLTEEYRYDVLGQRVKSWNNFYGESYAARTEYDYQGRVTSQIAQGGDTTTTTYVWSSTLANTGMGILGGWVETSTYANTRTTISKTDMFGREIEKKDMGDHVWRYDFDRAGRNVLGGLWNGSAIDATNRTSFTYHNTGLTASITGLTGSESYNYDANGNRVRELGVNGGVTYKSATAGYDALNRMTSWAEAGGSIVNAASTATKYDAVGNIRKTEGTYWAIDGYGNVTGGAAIPFNFWYRYDAMNRVVVDKGYLDTTNNVIAYGAWGRGYGYDASGQRAYMEYEAALTGYSYEWVPAEGGGGGLEPPLEVGGEGPGEGSWQNVAYTYYGKRREVYTLTAAGQVAAVSTQDHGYTDAPGVGGVVSNGTFGSLSQISTFQYDLLGRMYSQADGSTYSRTVTYNAKNQIIHDVTNTLRFRTSGGGSDTFRAETHNDYDGDGYIATGTGSSYALGAVVWAATQNFKNNQDGDNPDTLTGFSYQWWDGAVQSSISYDKNFSMAAPNGDYYDDAAQWIKWSYGNTNFSSTFTINGLGQTTAAAVNDGVPKTLGYTLDANGQIIRRTETRNSDTGQMAPRELFYRFAGKQMGMVGNNGTDDVNYASSIMTRMAASPEITASNAGLFRNGTNTGTVGYADFSQSMEQYNSYQQSSAGGGVYTVRNGDTLQGIAAALYGDGNLWYRIAEANGLSAGSALVEGQSLMLPSGVSKNSHNASTFNPYDASEAMGDTLPTTPKPPKKPKCGAFGQLLMVAIAVAITVLLTAGAGAPLAGAGVSSFLGLGSAAAGSVVGGALAGVAGSIASQAFGVATGIQDKFSFKQVAIAGISGAIGGGLGAVAESGKLGLALGKIGASLGNAAKVVGDVARGVVGSVLSQGIGVATGLQNKFSFTNVALAGVGSAVGGATSRAWGNSFGAQIGSTMADTLAQAATRSILKGNSFGDNILASLPSAIGNLIGRQIGEGIGTAFDGKSGYISEPEYPEGNATPPADFAINTTPQTPMTQVDPNDVLGVTSTISGDGNPAIIVTGSKTRMTAAEHRKYKAQIKREEAEYNKPIPIAVKNVASDVAINSFTHQPMPGVSKLSWEEYIFALSEGDVGTGALDGSLKRIVQNGGSIERMAEITLSEIVQSVLDGKKTQDEFLSDAGVGPLLTLEQDHSIDAFLRLDDLGLELLGRTGNQSELFPYAHYFSNLLNDKVNEIGPGWRSISRHYEGIAGDPVSDIVLTGGISVTASALEGLGTVAVRQFAVRSMVPTMEGTVPRASVEAVSSEIGLAESPAASRLAQPGGLSATEGSQVLTSGGRLSSPTHPLVKHGPLVSDRYLQGRALHELAAKNRTGLRTAFNDRAAMESAIAETFSARQAEISTWLATGPRAGVTQAFETNPGMGNLGRGFEVTTKGGPVVPITRSMPNVKLVLMSNGQGGYVIHTAFPF